MRGEATHNEEPFGIEKHEHLTKTAAASCVDTVSRIATTNVSATTPKELVLMIVGRALGEVFVKPPPPSAQPVLNVDGLTVEGAGPASFAVMAGEILSLVGLRGAGHDVIGRAILGDMAPTGGTFVLGGARICTSIR
jgi:ribose transport system ATP-binding protein